jgi:hypothetical protein
VIDVYNLDVAGQDPQQKIVPSFKSLKSASLRHNMPFSSGIFATQICEDVCVCVCVCVQFIFVIIPLCV